MSLLFYRLKFHFVLLFRGWLIAMFLLVLFLGPIEVYADITATVICLTFSLILLCVVFITFLCGHHYMTKFKLSLSETTHEFISKKEEKIFITCPACNIFPLFNLTFQLQFEQENFKFPSLTIKGCLPIEQHITQTVVFPHRGKWLLNGINLSFSDQLGLTKFSWQQKIEKLIFYVKPFPAKSYSLPILSSFYKAGDLLTGQQEQQGEPLELRRYQPADGVKKISWKIFARSRVLMSRHQEAAASPEGQVAIFVLARTSDDLLASKIENYILRLIEAELEITFNCEGSKSLPVHSLELAKDCLIENAWHQSNLIQDILNFVEVCKTPNASLSNVLLFFDIERLKDKTFLKDLSNIQNELTNHQIEGIFILFGNKSNATAEHLQKNHWFLDSDFTSDSKSYYFDFMQIALRHKWQIYQEEQP